MKKIEEKKLEDKNIMWEKQNQIRETFLRLVEIFDRLEKQIYKGYTIKERQKLFKIEEKVNTVEYQKTKYKMLRERAIWIVENNND